MAVSLKQPNVESRDFLVILLYVTYQKGKRTLLFVLCASKHLTHGIISVNKLDSIQTAIQADRGPGRIRSVPITVANGRTIRVSAVGISDTGKAFANSSSFHLRWELNNCDDLAFWDDADKFRMSKSSWERYLALKNASGLVCVWYFLISLSLSLLCKC